MSGHTPGPWRLDGDRRNGWDNLTGAYVAQEEGGRICECFANCLVRHDETLRANARLIAAAPDLLAFALAYREAFAKWEISNSFSNVFDTSGELSAKANAAIAKATA